jgi:tRNA A-37 threonylcarbamoyl transferase component Bud32
MHSDPDATKLIPGSDEPLAGRYRLIEKVGEGGAAEVYRARDERLGRMVAIKRLRPQFTTDDASRSRFTIEARTAAGLSHPNIVDVYDFGESPDGSMWIAMQYVEGQNLKDLLHRRGRMTAAEVVQIVQQVCAALSVAHAKGLIHRDVKPQNIMIDRAGDVRLTDFGIVKALSGPELTMTGMTFGTAAYLSPEQATGEPLSPASDIYALGCVMYEMLAGTPPFTGENPAVVAYKQVWEQPRPLHDLVPEVPPSLESIVMRCLNKEPARRYPSTDMLAADLAAMSTAFNQPTQMVPVGTAGAAPGVVAGGVAAADTPVALEVTPRAETSQPIPMPGAAQHVPPVFAQTTAPAASLPMGVGQATRPVAAPYSPPPPAPTAQRAVPYDTRASRVTVVDTNRRGGAGVLLPLALLLLVLLGGIIIFLASQGVFGGTPGPTPPATATSAEPTATVAAVVPVTPTTVTLPTPTMLQPLATETPSPAPTDTPEPVPTDTPEPLATGTPEPPPTATPELPPPTAPGSTTDPTATVPVIVPPPTTNSVTLDDNAFVGGFSNPGGYHNRTAQWVYGQGTDYSSMTAGFNIREVPRGPGELTIVGLDSEDEPKTPMRLMVNGYVLYEGPNPLPNDDQSGREGPGNWGSYTWRLPPNLLVEGENSISIINLDPSDQINYPIFIMIDTVTVSW